jgi:hypothetical protein
VAPSSAARTTPAPSVVDPALAFRGLGTWVDTYDHGSLSPQGAISDMRRHGVRTLYLATARFNSPTDMLYPADVDAWLTAAHAAGMRVVGWYTPDYTDLALDVRRTLAIARFRSPTGQHFDALAVDIEYPLRVSDAAAWHAAVAAHLTQIRAATSMPLGAIVLPLLLMSAWPDPARWSGFPWTSIGHTADAVLLMSYWTSHTPARLCPTDPRYCAYQYTQADVQRSRQLTGLPVHAIGGVGGTGTPAEVSAFVQAARTADAIGGSFYDYFTTTTQDWSALQPLR